MSDGTVPSDQNSFRAGGKATEKNRQNGSTLANAGDDYAKHWINETELRAFINKVERVANSLVGIAYTSNPQYMCDNFVEQVIKDSGGRLDTIFKGPASSIEVKEHIENAIRKGLAVKTKKSDEPNLTDGAYVVFMGDSPARLNFHDHAGLLIVKDGVAKFIHNSRSNVPASVQLDKEVKSTRVLQDSYGYNSFYYLRIQKETN